MLCITLRIMGAKNNILNGDVPGAEPVPLQSSSRHLSNDQPTNQPFNEWHPHRLKTGLRNHPIGRKAPMIAPPFLGYNGVDSQLANTRGALVNNQSGPVAVRKKRGER